LTIDLYSSQQTESPESHTSKKQKVATSPSLRYFEVDENALRSPVVGNVQELNIRDCIQRPKKKENEPIQEVNSEEIPDGKFKIISLKRPHVADRSYHEKYSQ
jgi:hypothetical protein